jgi:hypothetical protein
MSGGVAHYVAALEEISRRRGCDWRTSPVDLGVPQTFSTPSLQFSGHETFPLRQLWLRKAFDSIEKAAPSAPRSIFSDEESIARFGVGRNMVTSIRHWSLACGFMDEGDGGYTPTGLARKLLSKDGYDPYLESPATVWLIHWKLAGIGAKSTTWWFLFNCVVQQTFDKDSLFRALKSYTGSVGHKLSDSTLTRDIDVCLASYLPKTANGSSKEDAAEPVLAELPLLQQHLGMKGSFSFRRGPKPTLPDALFIYSLVEFWERSNSSSVLSFEKISHDYGSPGRVFKLDEYTIGEKLVALEHSTKGMLRWTDTAGIRQVSKAAHFNPESLKSRLLEAMYG